MKFEFAHAFIELPVTNLVVAGTIVRQKARFKKLEHEQHDDGTCTVLIVVVLECYAAGADPDEYGPKLTGQRFIVEPFKHWGDNDTIVDAATGVTLRIRTNETPEQWEAVHEEYPQATINQGDFFELMRRNGVLDIDDLITYHIQEADRLGRYL